MLLDVSGQQPKELSVPLHTATFHAKDLGWKTPRVWDRLPGAVIPLSATGCRQWPPRAARRGSRDLPDPIIINPGVNKALIFFFLPFKSLRSSNQTVNHNHRFRLELLSTKNERKKKPTMTQLFFLNHQRLKIYTFFIKVSFGDFNPEILIIQTS